MVKILGLRTCISIFNLVKVFACPREKISQEFSKKRIVRIQPGKSTRIIWKGSNKTKIQKNSLPLFNNLSEKISLTAHENKRSSAIPGQQQQRTTRSLISKSNFAPYFPARNEETHHRASNKLHNNNNNNKKGCKTGEPLTGRHTDQRESVTRREDIKSEKEAPEQPIYFLMKKKDEGESEGEKKVKQTVRMDLENDYSGCGTTDM